MSLRLSELRMEPSPRQSLSVLPETSQSLTYQICCSCLGFQISCLLDSGKRSFGRRRPDSENVFQSKLDSPCIFSAADDSCGWTADSEVWWPRVIQMSSRERIIDEDSAARTHQAEDSRRRGPGVARFVVIASGAYFCCGKGRHVYHKINGPLEIAPHRCRDTPGAQAW